ncbi:putative RING-type domain-containing protein [Seiridium cardinale]|uniref:RING-type domain-containing protein n=1 Tax=Seiridium cardinale TaxID=138064 RepID=A0ABR2Y5M9_9PEZI
MSTSSLPELAEADFFGQVFYLAPDNAASVIDDLVTKATGLGISVSRSSIALSTTDKRFASSAESNVTVDTSHARTASTESKCSASTTLTSASSDNYTQESVSTALNRKRSRNLAFSQYDKLLAQINPNLDQPKFPNLSPPTERHSSTASLFSVSTRKSYLGIRNGILKIRRKRRPCPFPEALVNSCSACREDFKPDQVLEKLPCGHSYCTKCLRIMINQSSKDETKMPPRCCTQPIPGLMIRSLLSREEQTSFLKAVQLYSTPWENRFCYVCGGVWTTVGCPNYCNGEEELERRRIEEAERLAAQEAEEALAKEEAEKEAAENVDAEERTKESIEFQTLRISQAEELERFRVYERKTKWLMWTRQSQEKLALVEKQSATIEKMKERHVKTTVNLEDRQVQAELELRGSLEQSERNVRIRLKHMEAYCDGLGQNPSSGMPRRVVTERDLRELGQQYNVEKNMRQLHQAKINVMRDRQAKALEELQQRQEAELGKLLEKDHAEIEALESSFADQEDTLAVTFNRRRQTMDKRWELSMRILQKELESKTGLRYSILAPLQWPQEKDSSEYGLSPVEE